MEGIRVPLSNNKILTILIGSIVFVGVQVMFWFQAYDGSIIHTLGRIATIIGIPFFVFCAIYATRKLFDQTPGLLINNDGITDNSSALSAGRIGWANITGFRMVALGMNQKAIAILVNNADEIIARQSGLKQKAMASNLKKYMTPVIISAVALNCNLADLNQELTSAFDQQKPSI